MAPAVVEAQAVTEVGSKVSVRHAIVTSEIFVSLGDRVAGLENLGAPDRVIRRACIARILDANYG